ncbi:MAG TPA: allantoicase [Actinospica sp.]|jgi:allantoicase|nr:allantoicase [Actinospica sp.]
MTANIAAASALVLADLDLASRALGGAVVWANDEFFGMKENLVTPAPPTFSPHTFDLKGQVVDGWETRRRRPGTVETEATCATYDSAIIRLGAPGLIRSVTVDTSFFVGNYPPACSIEAADVRGYPSPHDLLEADWTTIVPESKLTGDTRNVFELIDSTLRRIRFTHVRLNNIPDGGIARLRVHGEVLPDPEFTVGVQCDLAAARNGARVTASSDAFFSPATAALMPGESRVMGDGWETARRRDSANDWIEVQLIGEATPVIIEIDTANYKGNAPARIRLRSRVAEGDWIDLIPETPVQPDTLHRFRLKAAHPATHLRLDTYPDGGIARLRVHGHLTPQGAATVHTRWTAANRP